FGGGVTAQLAERGVPVRAMAHRAERAESLKRPGVEPVVADLDRPETLDAALAGAETVFLVSPMDDRVQVRERNVLEAAQRARVRRIVKLHGAVEHHGDPLGSLHDASGEARRHSGPEAAPLSPTAEAGTRCVSSV